MRKNFRPKEQRGIATLLTTVVILLVMSVMAIYASRSALLENTLMNNSYRSKQATEIADAALDFGLATFLANGADSDNNNVADVMDPSGVTNGRRAEVRFCDPTSTLINCIAPTNLNRIMIVAAGWSDDQTAVHRSSLLVASNPFFGASPKAPLIIKGAGTSFLTGNLTLVNNTDTGINVWTGTDIGSANGSFETYGKVVTRDGAGNITNTALNQLISEKSQNKYFLGPDIVYNDQNLKNATTNQFYESMIGRDKSSLKSIADYSYTAAEGLSAGQSYAGKIVYIDGDYDLRQSLGSASESTILVVNGRLTMSGNLTVHGSIIANNLGNITGTPTINGSLIAENATSLQGNVTIQMTQQAINNLNNLRVKSVVGNSWRDW